MERLNVPAAGIERSDILLTAKADDPAIIYTDVVYVTDNDGDFLPGSSGRPTRHPTRKAP